MEEAKLLYIENGAPVMRHQRIDLDSEGKPTEFTQSIYRADWFKSVVRLRQGRSQEDQDDPTPS